MDRKKFAKTIDHTLLKPDINKDQVAKLCREAQEYGFFSVCLPPCFVSQAKKLLDPSILVCTVVGFPLGYNHTKAKVMEAKTACDEGANELDMVMNLTAFKSGEDERVLEDIRAVVEIGTPVKVIVETCLLSKEEIVRACGLVEQAKASFIKTSTGFSHAGADVEDIKLMKKELGDDIKIKASGGISTLDKALQLIEAGARRLGTSSGVLLMKQFR
ncbi:MAG: deoxyribose-phosphate aldolase [Halobacteriovoraceae bacterium]|nr:deoxyribose-phosphate aldolase [Halobacteriovoraceae bacterium]